MKESETQKAILEWLDWKHIFHYRNNSGAFVDSNEHFYRFGAVGSPDIVFVVNGQYAGIEVEASKGRQSDNQKEFQRQLEAAGGRYILAHSLDDVVNAFPKAAWNPRRGLSLYSNVYNLISQRLIFGVKITGVSRHCRRPTF